MNYEMLIFDMDGTLWDTTDITLEATNNIAEKYSVVDEVNIDQVKCIMGLSKEEGAATLMPNLSLDISTHYIDLQIEEVVRLIKEKGARIYDGVIDTLKELNNTYKLAIVTNNKDEYAKIFIDKSNLNDYFTDYMGAASYNITKGEAIKKLIDRNNITKACYIGDIKKDMESAYEAGIDFIHARYGFEPDLVCDKHIDDIRELNKFL